MFKLHGVCRTATKCNDLNVSEGENENDCVCTGKKYHPVNISSFSPIPKPNSPKCIDNCSDFYLSFIPNDQGLINDKCASCENLDSTKSYFDIGTKACLSSCEDGVVVDSENKLCDSCKARGKYKVNNKCLIGDSCFFFQHCRR